MKKNMMIKKRFVGEINKEQNAFITHRYEEHVFRLWNGFGFNKDVIKRISESVREVWVYYHHQDESIDLLKTTPEFILAKGVEYKNPKDLKDTQLILPMNQFEWV